jgi:hypothetical protein
MKKKRKANALSRLGECPRRGKIHVGPFCEGQPGGSVVLRSSMPEGFYELAGPCWCGSGKKFRECHLAFVLPYCADCGCHMPKAAMESAHVANHRDGDANIVCESCWLEHDYESGCSWCGVKAFFADEYAMLVVFEDMPAILKSRSFPNPTDTPPVSPGVYWCNRFPFDCEEQICVRSGRLIANRMSRLCDVQSGMKQGADYSAFVPLSERDEFLDCDYAGLAGVLCPACCGRILQMARASTPAANLCHGAATAGVG